MSASVISPDVWANLVKAGEACGLSLLQADKSKIEGLFEPLATDDVNKIITALATNLNMGGVASVMNKPLKNAILETEPTVDGLITSNIESALNSLQTLLQNKVNGV